MLELGDVGTLLFELTASEIALVLCDLDVGLVLGLVSQELVVVVTVDWLASPSPQHCSQQQPEQCGEYERNDEVNEKHDGWEAFQRSAKRGTRRKTNRGARRWTWVRLRWL